MEDAGNYVAMPSPSSSQGCQYLSADHEYYLDTNNSDSPGSAASPHHVYVSTDFTKPHSFPSPDSRVAKDESQSPTYVTATEETQSKPAMKRKRENRYKNAPPSVLSRRRAQNRASQRAYRERKDQRIKDLEQMLGDVRSHCEVLAQAYRQLEVENSSLRATSSSPPHPHPHPHPHPPSLALSHLPHHHQHHHHQCFSTDISTGMSAFPTIPATSTSHVNTGTGFVSPDPMAAMHGGSDLGAYLYQEMEGYNIYRD